MSTICVLETGLCFDVNSDLERYRVESLLEKEPETIAWIDSWSRQQEGAVFFDVGANIGIYSLYAAFVGKDSKIFAFEPVSNNYVALLNNVRLNSMANVHPFNLALASASRLTSLYLSDLRVGNSGAQIDAPIDEKGTTYVPKRIETVLSTSMDALVSDFGMPTPNFVKIDVDGREPEILLGMSNTLRSSALRSILIEFNSADQFSFWERQLSDCGLFIDHSYDSLPNHSGIRRQSKGTLARNYIFGRRA